MGTNRLRTPLLSRLHAPRVQIGKLRIDDSKDKDKIQMATLNPEFFRVFEFQVTMPGESQLKLKVRCEICKDGPAGVARDWW